MFCPRCGNQTSDEIKFCKQCGANLRGVQEALTARGDRFDWSKTWVADMFLTEEERERRQGVTPEVKRLNEIKGGVITGLVGIGVMIFFRFFFEAVANAEGGTDAEIIRNLWLVGLVPFLVGIGLIFNGLFISKRIVKLKGQRQSLPLTTPESARFDARTTDELMAAPASQLSDYSVTEHTTAHLPEAVPRSPRRES